MTQDCYVALAEGARLPQRAHPTDAGYDLTLSREVFIKRGEVILASTGVYAAIPEGCVGKICERSSTWKRGVGIANKEGVIDSGYRGEIKIALYVPEYAGKDGVWLAKGERIAQLLILPLAPVRVREVPWHNWQQLLTTSRGEGGFGSTDQGP